MLPSLIPDISYQIYEYLDFHEMDNLGQVSHRVRQIIFSFNKYQEYLRVKTYLAAEKTEDALDYISKIGSKKLMDYLVVNLGGKNKLDYSDFIIYPGKYGNIQFAKYNFDKFVEKKISEDMEDLMKKLGSNISMEKIIFWQFFAGGLIIGNQNHLIEKYVQKMEDIINQVPGNMSRGILTMSAYRVLMQFATDKHNIFAINYLLNKSRNYEFPDFLNEIFGIAYLYAIENQNDELIDQLEKDKYLTDFYRAKAMSNSYQKIEKDDLEQKLSNNTFADMDKMELLNLAIDNDDLELVQTLLDHNIDPYYKAIFFAGCKKEEVNPDLFKIFRRNGASQFKLNVAYYTARTLKKYAEWKKKSIKIEMK